MCRYSLSFLRYKELNSRNCQKSINFRLGPPCRNPLADLKNFASKRAAAYPLSIGLHLMTLRQTQKVAVLFTNMSTLTPKMFNPPPQGPPWADHPRTTSFPSMVFALPWTKISRRSHHPALRYPQPYKQKKQKNKSKLNITPNATLCGEIVSNRLTNHSVMVAQSHYITLRYS